MIPEEKFNPLPGSIADGRLCRLYEESIVELQRYIYVRTGSLEDAEDIAQEVFIRIWKRRAHMDEIATVKEYMFTIARNCVADLFRRKSRANTYVKSYCPVGISYADPVFEKEIRMIRMEAIDRLTERQKTAYLLWLEGFNRMTIADVLEISKNTVDIHLDHSQKRVRAYVGKKIGIRNQKKDFELAA